MSMKITVFFNNLNYLVLIQCLNSNTVGTLQAASFQHFITNWSFAQTPLFPVLEISKQISTEISCVIFKWG